MSSSQSVVFASSASGAVSLVDANTCNLEVARNLVDLSQRVNDEELKNSLLQEISRMLDNSEKISSALRVSKIIPEG